MAPGVAPVPRKRPWDDTLSGTDGADLAARFMSWYILDGHAGLNVSLSAVDPSDGAKQTQKRLAMQPVEWCVGAVGAADKHWCILCCQLGV